MQYCVENEHVVVPHEMVVGVPLDPPELVVPELEVSPELLAVPELEASPELLAVPELDDRPLEEETPDDVVVCWLEAWPRPSSPNSPSPPGPPVQATTNPIEKETTAEL